MITSEIAQVGGGELSSPEDAAVYLIHVAGQAALVDAGCGRSTRQILGHIRAHGVALEEIRYVLLTHCHFDHTGGADSIRKLTNCEIVAHELDAVFLEEGDSEVTAASWYGQTMIPLSIDVKLTGARGRIELGGRAIEAHHIPGHSPGSVVYVIESDGKKVIFAQDVHGPIHSSLLSNREDYLHSLNFLASLEADILCEGHYGVFEGKKTVLKFISRFM